jgi:hypothetical protein
MFSPGNVIAGLNYNTSANGGADMSAANTPGKTIRRITIHPDEAERIAAAFDESRRAAELDLTGLELIAASLDSGWEGIQKGRYLDELKTVVGRIRNILLPQLCALEKKYHDYSIETTAEDTKTG